MEYEILSWQFTSQTNPPLYRVNVCFKGWDFRPGNNILFWSVFGCPLLGGRDGQKLHCAGIVKSVVYTTLLTR